MAQPFQVQRNFNHHAMSQQPSTLIEMWRWGSLAIVLKLIRWQRNMWPSKIMWQAKLSLPIRDSNSRLLHFLHKDHNWGSESSSSSFWSGKAVSILCRLCWSRCQERSGKQWGLLAYLELKEFPTWKPPCMIVWMLSAQIADCKGPTEK